MLYNFVPGIDKEASCSPFCRSPDHALELINAITQDKYSELEIICFLCTQCNNPGRVLDQFGRSALHVAASVGKTRIVQWLVKYKNASIIAKDGESGFTPLHRAFYYGQIHTAIWLLQNGANPNLRDYDYLTTFDTCSFPLRPSSSDKNDFYVWGTNLNFNLGLNQSLRSEPTLLESLRKKLVNAVSVRIEQYHSCFLASDGLVYTCGYGQGGRLGHGDTAEVQVEPKLVESLKGEFVKQISLAVNHSLFLTTSGSVWACGSNDCHQLGIHASLERTSCFCPEKINQADLLAVGIAASRFHSLFWTDKFIVSWGLNSGQLGHAETGERTIIVPKVASLLKLQKSSSIVDACCNETATVVQTNIGDLFLLQDFRCIRIVSHRANISKIGLIGGGKKLKVFVLLKCGTLWLWTLNGRSLVYCSLLYFRREILVADFALYTGGCLVLISFDGRCFEARSIYPKKATIFKLRRVMGIYRGQSVVCEPSGNNICVVQAAPSKMVPSVEDSVMTSDMRSLLLDETSHDITLKVTQTNRSFSAHKYVLSSLSSFFATSLTPATFVIDISRQVESLPIDFIDQIPLYIYTNTCNSMDQPDTTSFIEKMSDIFVLLRPPKFKVSFDRFAFSSLCDASVSSNDGGRVAVHKCILLARMEYFRNMSSFGDATSDYHLNTNAKSLFILLDYVYTDTSVVLLSTFDVNLLCDVLLIADELLITRLIQLCERRLIQVMHFRDFPSLWKLATLLHNASQLRACLVKFISLNLRSFVESRILEGLDADSLSIVSDACSMMASKRISPYSEHSLFHLKPSFSIESLFTMEEKYKSKVVAKKPPRVRKASNKNAVVETATKAPSSGVLLPRSIEIHQQKKPVLKVEPLHGGTINKPETKIVACSAETLRKSWRRRPWNKQNDDTANNTPSFRQLMAEEKFIQSNFERQLSKPLSITVAEDRAINDLEIFYNVANTFEEHIEVRRATLCSQSPAPICNLQRQKDC